MNYIICESLYFLLFFFYYSIISRFIFSDSSDLDSNAMQKSLFVNRLVSQRCEQRREEFRESSLITFTRVSCMKIRQIIPRSVTIACRVTNDDRLKSVQPMEDLASSFSRVFLVVASNLRCYYESLILTDVIAITAMLPYPIRVSVHIAWYILTDKQKRSIAIYAS